MKPPTVAYSAGVFDTLHSGHVSLLWRAAHLVDVLIVGVVSDEGARAYKGALPEETQGVRMAAIARLPFVDVVVLQETTDPTPMLYRFRPDMMVHGDDWARLREGHENLERLGVEWVLLPHTPGISSSMLRKVG